RAKPRQKFLRASCAASTRAISRLRNLPSRRWCSIRRSPKRSGLRSRPTSCRPPPNNPYDLRAGELLALNVSDLDFTSKTISISKSADNNTRIIREPKTKNSTATLPMPSALEDVLRNYLEHHWKPNPPGLLFPNKKGTRPLNRDHNLVKYVLKPILKKLGIPAHNTGLHAFRHGLATELANASVPLPVLQ